MNAPRPEAVAPAAPAAEALPSADAVAAFLRAHPDFLAQHPDLLRSLAPPRRVHGEALADHMAAMLAVERKRTRSLEAEIEAVIAASSGGRGLTVGIRLAVLALMREADVMDVVGQEIPALLGLESCTLLSEAPDRRGVLKLPRGAVAGLLGGAREAVVRPLPTDAVDLLHPECAAMIRRDALVRVPHWTNTPTLLALGARDPQALPLRHATPVLGFLGCAVAAAMAR